MEENRQLETAAAEPKPSQTALDRARQAAMEAGTRFRSLDPRQRTAWTGAALCVLAVLVGFAWFGTRSDWRVLYAGLEPDDARAISAELTTSSIPFDVSPDGTTLRVSAGQLDKARLATTAKGGPKSGRMGFELFDKPNWIGSDFDEKVNYQRALEGELEHTIDTLAAVQSARVHLVLPHDSLFTEQQRDAKASVVLTLRHRSLSEEEASSIRNLVASAVDGLRADNVSLVDASGRALGAKSGDAALSAHEQELADKLIQTLEPVAGTGNVRASVNVEYDSSSADELDETYDPNNVVTLSMQRSEQTSGTQPAASGVPGTASNAPNVQPPLFPSQNAGGQNLKQESGTYGASRRVRHTLQGAGRVRRITAALLINHRMQRGRREVSWQPRTTDEMKRIQELAQAAIGFDAARGDQVSVEDIAFEDNSAPALAGFAERLRQGAEDWSGLLRYGMIGAGLLGLFLFVLRPMLRRLDFAPAAAGGNLHLAAAGEMEAGARAGGGPALLLTEEQAAVEKQRQQAQLVFDNVAEQIRRDPAQTARLLQSWIHTE